MSDRDLEIQNYLRLGKNLEFCRKMMNLGDTKAWHGCQETLAVALDIAEESGNYDDAMSFMFPTTSSEDGEYDISITRGPRGVMIGLRRGKRRVVGYMIGHSCEELAGMVDELKEQI